MNQPTNPAPQPMPLIPGNFATIRASYSFIAHLNGQFLVSIGEDRMITDNQGKLAAANFEVARVEMGPLAMLWLAKNALDALIDYEKTFGPLPASILPAQAPKVQEVIDALETMLRAPRERPPEPPGSS